MILTLRLQAILTNISWSFSLHRVDIVSTTSNGSVTCLFGRLDVSAITLESSDKKHSKSNANMRLYSFASSDKTKFYMYVAIVLMKSL